MTRTTGDPILPAGGVGGLRRHLAAPGPAPRPSPSPSPSPRPSLSPSACIGDGLGPGYGFGLRDVTQAALPLLANAPVVAALLVYFGWRRTETQAEHLGIDASLLDTSLRTYLLGSVGPVFVLLLAVSVAGLLAVAMDRHLVPLVRAGERRGVVALRLLRHAWMILPALVWSLGYVWRAQSYVLLPASIGGGVALTLYATELRQLAGPLDERERRRTVTARQAGALLAGITLFWTASNYAQVLGTRQAEAFAEGIHGLPEVVVHSSQRLHLSGPGVTEARLPGEGGAARYRYDGLRLAGQSGGKLYLVLDGWTMADGDFVVVRDDLVARLDLRR